jgi:hypothetical protein
MLKFLNGFLVVAFAIQSFAFAVPVQAADSSSPATDSSSEFASNTGIVTPCKIYNSPVAKIGIVKSTFDPNLREVVKVVVTADHYLHFEDYNYDAGTCTPLGSYTIKELLGKKQTADHLFVTTLERDGIYFLVTGLVGYGVSKFQVQPNSASVAKNAESTDAGEAEKTVKLSFTKDMAEKFEKIMATVKDFRNWKFKKPEFNAKTGLFTYLLISQAPTAVDKLLSYFDPKGPYPMKKLADEVLPPEVLAGESYNTTLSLDNYLANLKIVLNNQTTQ